MAENRTDKSCYESRFGGGWVTAEQWLAENMCSRKARAIKGGDLPPKFWNDPYWNKELRLQLKHAYELLKMFDMQCILSALKDNDAKKVYSLGLRSVLDPLIKQYQKKLDTDKLVIQPKTNIEKVDTEQKPRQPFSNKKSNLQRLRDLDG